jgi:nucleoside-diphosphate-sugar epimerase
MKKLIIGCGYLGLRVAKKWVQQGDEVFALTRTEERGNQLSSLGIQPIIGNIADVQSISSLPAVESVLYSLGYDRFSKYSRKEIVIDGLKNFLEFLPVSVNNFLFTSSISVYGQSSGEWVDENSETSPEKESGQVCLEAEEVVRSFFLKKEEEKEQTIHWMILRLAGIYGPGRVLQKKDAIQAGQPIGGEPEAWLNLIHVDDASEAILKAEQKITESSLLLISDSQPVTRREYYQQLASLMNAPEPVFDPALKNQQRGIGLNKRCQNQKMKQTLDFDLMYPDYKTGLKSIIENES